MNVIKRIVRNWKTGIMVLILAAWASVPFATSEASAVESVPLIVRNAILASPTGSVNPHGAAVWQLYADGNRELEVEIEDVNLAQGTSLSAVINGSAIGQLVLDNRGKGKLKLKTEDGQTVPTINDGFVVQVRNGNTILVTGVFGGGPTPSPSPTGTPIGTPSPSPSVSPTATPAGTPSPSPSPSVSPSPSPSPTGTPIGTLLVVRNAILRSPTGSEDPHGAAQWQLYTSGHRELEVEIEDTNLAQGTSLTAFIDGNAVGRIVIDDRGKGKLKLRTEDGQTVPTVNAGAIIQVRNGNIILVSGIFGGGGPTPSPSPSVSPTATPTGTPSPSPSPSVSPTPSPSPSVTPNGGDLFAGLTGATINGALPTGYATYEIHSSRTELEVRIRQVNLAIGTTLEVTVNGIAAGNISIQSGGEGRLRLRSDDGQIVPMIVSGSTIAIRNGQTAVLSGAFTGFATPSPSPSPTGTPGPTPSPTPAAGRSFEAHLTGSQVTPPVITTGNGEIKVTLNAAETQAAVFGEFHNLSSSQTGARIETTVGTITTIRDLGIVGGRSGEFPLSTFAVSTAQVQQLRAGLWSAVIASVNNPNGEIRGRLSLRSSVSDFNGDGVSDFAVFRPSSSTWYAANSDGFSAQTFGNPGDRVVSGDYDGDGKTDAAVYTSQAGQGVWQIKRSSDDGVTTEFFGLEADIPVRGDFDGDGRLDIAVFRPSSGVWFIHKSDNSGYQSLQFGVAGDKPIPADMDGDGKDDIVVYRPSEGNWYWLRSSDGEFAAVNWGISTDIPVRGDFDGDGKADPTVYRPSEGTWYTLRSSDNVFQAYRFGLADDIPVAGKYDSDGKTDIAVFRPSEGSWFIIRSSDGKFQAYKFGSNGDIPLTVK